VPVVAPRSPGDCFDAALEASRIALTYRTPVILLSDGYLANGAEPWAVPATEELPDLSVQFASEPNGENGEFLPYLRDPETLARAWAVPGTAGLQHRIGGLEKADKTGNISYDPANHDFMVRTRQAKIDGIAATIPATEVDDPDGDARVAVIGWGSTYGPIGAACRRIRASGRSIAQVHLRHLNPLPADLGDILARYDRIVCPEMNLGQLAMILRAKYLIDVQSHTQVRGLPFRAAELAAVLQDVIDGTTGTVPSSDSSSDTPAHTRAADIVAAAGISAAGAAGVPAAAASNGVKP
jgi:2-oxoglutarate/2-oxoacid ferredoxin oxidoreductase subunit alpha